MAKLREQLPDVANLRDKFFDPQATRDDAAVTFSATYDARDGYGRTIQRVLDVQYDTDLRRWAWRTRRRAAVGGAWYRSHAELARDLAQAIAARCVSDCNKKLWAVQALAEIANRALS